MGISVATVASGRIGNSEACEPAETLRGCPPTASRFGSVCLPPGVRASEELVGAGTHGLRTNLGIGRPPSTASTPYLPLPTR